MIQTKEDLKELFEAGQIQTEAKMVDLIDSCYNDSGMPDAYEVATTMPTTIPLGKLVLYNGTLWRGLKTGESTLAQGTPFPVCGYKEIVVDFNTTTNTLIKNTSGENVTTTNTGSSIKTITKQTNFVDCTIFVTTKTSNIISQQFVSSNIVNVLIYDLVLSIQSGSSTGLTSGSGGCFVSIKIYPPTA